MTRSLSSILLTAVLLLVLPAAARAAPSATGDFDGDGYGDLAVGSPGEDVSGVSNTGVVSVLYGSRRGLTTRDELFGQGFGGVPGTREPEQNFGRTLAAGDFDGNGRADLAVGIPDDTVDGQEGAGAVTVLYSTTGGVSAGDLDGDGEDDLAIGIPGGRIGGDIGAGAVAVPGAVTHVIRRTYD